MSYFRKFIRNYAQVAKPLTDLTRGNPQKIVWSNTAQNALDHLKKALTSEPILSLPDFQTGQFVVTTDASNKGIGAILSQIINGEERVIAYASRTLTSGESNYSATQLELLSIIHHLDKFRHYLVGRKFKLRSDHKSLQYLQTFKKPTGILARWILKIQDLDYEFEHLKGKQNAPCDYLSRFPDNTPEESSVLQSLLDQGPTTSQRHASPEHLMSGQSKPFISDVDFEKFNGNVSPRQEDKIDPTPASTCISKIYNASASQRHASQEHLMSGQSKPFISDVDFEKFNGNVSPRQEDKNDPTPAENLRNQQITQIKIGGFELPVLKNKKSK
ncbi:hypothetical protein QYM36_009405, partial [Artemia franciscana]